MGPQAQAPSNDATASRACRRGTRPGDVRRRLRPSRRTPLATRRSPRGSSRRPPGGALSRRAVRSQVPRGYRPSADSPARVRGRPEGRTGCPRQTGRQVSASERPRGRSSRPRGVGVMTDPANGQELPMGPLPCIWPNTTGAAPLGFRGRYGGDRAARRSAATPSPGTRFGRHRRRAGTRRAGATLAFPRGPPCPSQANALRPAGRMPGPRHKPCTRRQGQCSEVTDPPGLVFGRRD